MLSRVCVLACVTSVLAAPVAAQRPDSLTGQLRRSFREVTAVQELADDRVLVLDSFERFVFLADFRTGESRVIGEQGMGDRQYMWPSRLLRLADDTTLIWDAIEGRVHVIDWVAGEPGVRRTIPRSSFAPHAERPLFPVASDGVGRMYSELPIGTGGTALVRWSPRDTRIDTVFRFRQGSLRGVFPSHDRWIVSPTGVIAYVNVSTYRVDLRGPDAAVVAGKPIAFDPIPVTPAVQRAWLEALREPKIMWSQMSGEPPRFTESTDGGLDYTGPWPLVTPAIVARKPLMQFASDGSLLIERTAVAALPTDYDVIDEKAELKDRFSLAPGTRIVATGRDVVYLGVRGLDGRLTVQRFTVRRSR